MKLIYCPICNDVRKLRLGVQTLCICEQSGGEYVDDLNAVLRGKAIPIGLNNSELAEALKKQPEEGLGYVFGAFVIPKNCPTVSYEDW